MTIFESEILSELVDWYASKVSEAIKTKPINRQTKAKGMFSSVVDATGNLAASPRKEIGENEIVLYAASYIDKLIYGERPGQFNGSVLAIEDWMRAKGVEYRAESVAQNLLKYGNSIWQEHQGANSGLLDDINLLDKVEETKQRLVLMNMDQIAQSFKEMMAA